MRSPAHSGETGEAGGEGDRAVAVHQVGERGCLGRRRGPAEEEPVHRLHVRVGARRPERARLRRGGLRGGGCHAARRRRPRSPRRWATQASAGGHGTIGRGDGTAEPRAPRRARCAAGALWHPAPVSKPLALRFVTSADRLDRLPPTLGRGHRRRAVERREVVAAQRAGQPHATWPRPRRPRAAPSCSTASSSSPTTRHRARSSTARATATPRRRSRCATGSSR